MSIVATAIGFDADSINVARKECMKDTLFVLDLAPHVYGFSEITVEGNRPDRDIYSFGVKRIGAKELELVVNAGGESDIFEYIKSVPGVSAVSSFSSGIRVRGLGFQYNQVRVDGVEAIRPYHMAGFMGTVQSDMIDHVDFFKDGAPARFGDNLSSIIDIQTKNPGKQEFRAKAALSLTNASLAFDIPFSENFGVILGGRSMYLGSVVRELSDDAILYSFHDIFGKATFSPDSANQITFTGMYASDQGIIDSKTFFKNYYFDGDWQTYLGALNWDHRLDASTTLRLTIGRSDFQLFQQTSELEDGSKVALDWGTRDYTLRGHLSTSVHRHRITVGLEWHHLTTNYDDYLSPVRYFYPKPLYGAELSVAISSIFLDDVWQISPHFFVTPGIRVSYFPEREFIEPQPRLGLVYSLSNQAELRASLSRSAQFMHLIAQSGLPIPNEQRYASSAEYPPEIMNSISVGGTWSGGMLALQFISLDAYFRDLGSLYDIASYPSDRSIAIGSGKGCAYGIESSIDGRWGALGYHASYALGWSERQFADIHHGAIFPAKDDIRHDFFVQGQYHLTEQLEVGLSWMYVSGSRMTVPIGERAFRPGESNVVPVFSSRNQYRLPGYHKLDVTLRYQFLFYGLRSSAFVNVYNCYNAPNMFHYYYYDHSNIYSFPYKLDGVKVLPTIPSIGFSVEY